MLKLLFFPIFNKNLIFKHFCLFLTFSLGGGQNTPKNGIFDPFLDPPRQKGGGYPKSEKRPLKHHSLLAKKRKTH